VRRLLILLLFGLVLAGGVAVTWQAMGQAKLVEEDLVATRALLARASGFESGKLSSRLHLIDQAQVHTLNAERRLGRWPLRHVGLLPLLGRDVRVASTVASSATGIARSTRTVVTAWDADDLEPRMWSSGTTESTGAARCHQSWPRSSARQPPPSWRS
jgi:hypothetical protein